jgi:hypothetical protein
MESFSIMDMRARLFQESIDQNVVVCSGETFVIQAGKWEWSLAREMKRIGSQQREIGISDAVLNLKNYMIIVY